MTEPPLFDTASYTLPATPCSWSRVHRGHYWDGGSQGGTAINSVWCPGVERCPHECKFCGEKL